MIKMRVDVNKVRPQSQTQNGTANPNPPPPQIEDEAVQRAKRTIFSSLMVFLGGAGLNFPFILSRANGLLVLSKISVDKI